MTDSQHFLDLARQQLDSLSADVERHFDQVAAHLREWIPYDQRTHTVSFSPPARKLPPPTTFQLLQRWVGRNKALTAAIVAFVVTGGVGALVYVKQSQGRRRRRARKSASGARTEVVVLAGAVANPLTSALYLDLERRGFIVYAVVSTQEEESYIRSQNRADLLPLHLDLLDPFTAQQQSRKFHGLMGRSHAAFEGAEAHRLRLAGLVVVPETQSGVERMEDVSSEEWSDALNAKVLKTIATTRLFLPVVTEQRSRILFLAPNVIPSLHLPGHGVESTVYGALESFFASLRAEVAEYGVSVSQFKLGDIDVPPITARQRREGVPAPRWRATPQRRLHDAVFDALVARRPARTWYVGRGSLAYEMVGRWVPRGLVGWMTGVGAQRRGEGGLGGSRAGVGEGLRLDDSQGSLGWERVEQE